MWITKLTELWTRLGVFARPLKIQWGTRWDVAGDIGTDIATLIAAIDPTLIVTGTFTTSSATVPADTGRAEATGYWNGAVIIPLTGNAAFQKRRIKTFTTGTGVLALYTGFTVAPGLVDYVIIPDRSRAYYETVEYAPDVMTTGDLEAATKTINAVAEGAVADYSANLTLRMPSDLRWTVLRIASRSSITPDSFNAGCTSLRCRIYVDTQDANHLLQDITIGAAANYLKVEDCYTGTKETIFNLVKDGAAHSYKFFFWVDAGNAIISVVQLWVTTGSTTVSSTAACLSFDFNGYVAGGLYQNKQGTGTLTTYVYIESATDAYGSACGAVCYGGTSHLPMPLTMSYSKLVWVCFSSVATDIAYIRAVKLVLRTDI